MNNIISRFASSFAALLKDTAVSDYDDRMEAIRDAMLEALAPHIASVTSMPKAWASIARATDVDSLWYLRSDLLGLLADYCGEPSARATLSTITEMFRGLIPNTQMPKAGRFNR